MNLVFDSSSIISIATNNLLWTLEKLKKQFKGDFVIPQSVRKELIENPLKGKKYKLEAIMIMDMLNDGVLKIGKGNKDYLMNLSNNIFTNKGKNINIVQEGEIEVISIENNNICIIDERTTRMLIEDPINLRELLESKLHSKVSINHENLNEFKEQTKNTKIIRSTELMTIAFEKGLFNDLFTKNLKKDFLDGLLWGLKLRGCAISSNEINQILRLEGF